MYDEKDDSKKQCGPPCSNMEKRWGQRKATVKDKTWAIAL